MAATGPALLGDYKPAKAKGGKALPAGQLNWAEIAGRHIEEDLGYVEAGKSESVFHGTVRLYDFQEEGIKEVDSDFEKHDNVMLELPTGCGKTITSGAFVQNKLKASQRILFLSNRDILVTQAIDKFSSKLGIYPLREQAGERAYEMFDLGGIDSRCVAGSVQTMQMLDRLHKWDPNSFDYLISDEAHRCTGNGWKYIRNYFKSAKHLGLSATPGPAMRANLFQGHVKTITLAEAIDRGFLVRPVVRRVKSGIKLDKIGLVGKGKDADFDQEELAEEMFKHTAKLATSIKSKVKKMRFALFCPTVDFARTMAVALSDIGVSCESVSYKSPDPQDTIKRFANKEFQGISNNVILTEGWDDQDLECIVLLNPSVKQERYIQIIGRGLRTSETIEKTECIIFDYVGITSKHGLENKVVSPTDIFIEGDLADPYNVQLRQRARKLNESGDEPDALKAVQRAKKELDEALLKDPDKRRVHREMDFGDEKVITFDPVYTQLLGMPSRVEAKNAFQEAATLEQKQLITRMSKGKLKVDNLTKEGAGRVIADLRKRAERGMVMPAQANTLRLLGCPMELRVNMTAAEASAWIDQAPKPAWWNSKR